MPFSGFTKMDVIDNERSLGLFGTVEIRDERRAAVGAVASWWVERRI